MESRKTGEVIYKRRKDLGLTQNQLAKSLNISFQAVSKWENGESLNLGKYNKNVPTGIA